MRNIQQGIMSLAGNRKAQMFMCSLVVVLATGCAWDGKELPAQAADVPAAAPQVASEQGMDLSRMLEIAKREAVVADLPAQF